MDVQNDKALDIALGNSRKTKTWKNKTVRWSELLDRLSAVTRTPETMAEYKAMTREQQSRIKDVGGFVGGYCNNGSRSDIRFRSILCLDADFADGDLWPDWELLYGSAAAIYSTHKHTTEKPRYRLVVPLSRSVDCDEYQAIGRRVAATLGIDKFDDTSYQPQRMMYWPSCSQDAPYVFRHTDGAFLDPDTVLATYHDWRDVSGWPMSSRVAEIVRKSAAKQKDPLEKGGIVGAFCRAYSMQEAIAEFVPAYRACDDPGRYTYTEGSTAAGVVIYDDKFSFSHHGTDPASGQLCNAWDLVRLHRFGELDGECGADTPVSSRPSYRAMAQLASGDKRVKAQIVTDRMSEAAADFGGSAEDGEDILATPSTSVAARPAIVATTSVAKETVPSGFSSSFTSEGLFSTIVHTSFTYQPLYQIIAFSANTLRQFIGMILTFPPEIPVSRMTSSRMTAVSCLESDSARTRIFTESLCTVAIASLNPRARSTPSIVVSFS